MLSGFHDFLHFRPRRPAGAKHQFSARTISVNFGYEMKVLGVLKYMTTIMAKYSDHNAPSVRLKESEKSAL